MVAATEAADMMVRSGMECGVMVKRRCWHLVTHTTYCWCCRGDQSSEWIGYVCRASVCMALLLLLPLSVRCRLLSLLRVVGCQRESALPAASVTCLCAVSLCTCV